jgi:hypothetical protein
MASSEGSVGWMEQILVAADLSDLLPAAMAWADKAGCRASDLTVTNAEDLAWSLHLKPIPATRLINAILQAVQDNTLRDDDPVNPCMEILAEHPEFETKAEQSEPDQDSPPPSPSAVHSSDAEPPLQAVLASGQTSFDQVMCVEHEKWRDPSKVEINAEGQFTCSAGHKCMGGRRQRSPGRLLPARSPLPRRKRRRTSDSAPRTWSSEDISAHIAGLGRYPAKSQGLRREPDGSFSLESLMSHWGHGAGLSTATVQKAIQDNLSKDIGRGTPLLRFSISQGPSPRDPVMIKVPHPAKS